MTLPPIAEQLVAVVHLAPSVETATFDIALNLGLAPDAIADLVDEISIHLVAADEHRDEAPFADCPHRHPRCIEDDCERAGYLRCALTEYGLALGAAAELAALVPVA